MYAALVDLNPELLVLLVRSFRGGGGCKPLVLPDVLQLVPAQLRALAGQEFMGVIATETALRTLGKAGTRAAQLALSATRSAGGPGRGLGVPGAHSV